ncbi:MAG TPA: CPBP family intramembrane glutamic endopeptidase [Spirochaetia bacterium]|nr:CPBP family intramembrane glutamic endopeptidase [Spirochaetia bacterium]
MFSVFFLPGIVVQSGGFDRQLFGSLTFNLQVMIQAVPQILLLLYLLDLQSPGAGRALGLSASFGRIIPGALFGAVALFMISGTVGLVAGIAAGPKVALGPFSGATWSIPSLAIIPLLLLTSLAVGYREEIFFRAYLIMRLDRIGVAPAATVGISAVLFAAGHMYEGIPGMVVALFSGAFLAMLYRRSRNLHQVALSHAIYNFAVLLLSGVTINH